MDFYFIFYFYNLIIIATEDEDLNFDTSNKGDNHVPQKKTKEIIMCQKTLLEYAIANRSDV